MQRSSNDKPPAAWRVGFASGVAAFASLLVMVAYAVSLYVSWQTTRVEAPRTIGTPLRLTSDAGDAFFMVTAQQETRTVGGTGRWATYHGFETVTHLDLWRLDARTAQPTWRKRLRTERNGSTFDIALMGAEGDRIWLFLREPLVLSAASGEILADAITIEARNPPLAGVLPRQKGHYSFFNGYGLVFTAADARAWRLDLQSLTATPWEPKSAARNPAAISTPHYAPQSLTTFQKRGLLLARDWLGVLTDDEAAALNGKVQVPGATPGERPGAMAAFMEANRAPPDLSHAGPKRYRLWRAKVEQVSAAPADWPKSLPDRWGLRPRYSNFVAFEKSPEFLQAGLMSDGRSALPILLKDPDRVLVLHRDRVDEAGRLHVTRIAGPDGRVLWDAALPLSVVQSVMHGANTLLLFGRSYLVPRPADTDAYNSAHEWLISLDLASGAARTFNISEVDADKR